jgi:hypothetical protein
MKEYKTTIDIQASPETIWQILTNAPDFPNWNPGIEKVEGRIAPGEKVTVYTKLTPGRAFPVKVAEFVPNSRMVWRGGMPLGLFTGVRTYTLTPTSDGTTNFTMHEVFSGPLLALIAGSIPDLSASFEQFAAGLKARAENGA